jgi:hypothetical protein
MKYSSTFSLFKKIIIENKTNLIPDHMKQYVIVNSFHKVRFYTIRSVKYIFYHTLQYILFYNYQRNGVQPCLQQLFIVFIILAFLIYFIIFIVL